jgi:hypothetical protein
VSLCSRILGKESHHGARPDEGTSWGMSLFRLAAMGLFMSCLFYSCEDVFDPVDKMGYLAMANLVARGVDPFPPNRKTEIVVVGIDDIRYAHKYNRTTPLPRCRLLEDLQKLYEAGPRLIVIDLDVSPTIERQNEEQKTGRARSADTLPSLHCERNIDAFLRESRVPIVLITPRPLDSDLFATYAKAKHEWMEQMCMCDRPAKEIKHLAFADPYVHVGYGTATHYFASESSLGHVVNAMREDPYAYFPGKACQQVCKAESFEKNDFLSGERTQAPESLRPINFRPVRSQISRIYWGEDTLASGELTDKVVFFGARYGEDDLYLTPIGDMYGVDLHASAAVTAGDRVREHKFLSIFLDVVSGVFFGIVVSWFWGRYFDTVLADRPIAYLWLIAFAITYLAFVLLALRGALSLLEKGIWLSPVSMAIGMFVDAFVVGGVEGAKEKLERTTSENTSIAEHTTRIRRAFALFPVVSGTRPSPRQIRLPRVLRRIITDLPCAIALITIGFGLVKAIRASFADF